MEWTKIKPKHFLFNDLPISQKGALATILCLTAYLERIPTEREMIKNTQVHCYKALSKRLVTMGVNLEYVMSKVLEDCERINHKKSVSRETSRRYVENKKANDVSNDTTDKRREEKRREEKIYIKVSGCDFIKITQEEFEKLNEYLGKHTSKELIEDLNLYIGSKGKKYKDHYLTILSWWRKNGKKTNQKDISNRQEKEFEEKYGDPAAVNPEGQKKVSEIIQKAMGGE